MRKLTTEQAIEVIERLRDYAYENWDELEYGERLDEIGEAVDYIKRQLEEEKNVGTAEIHGKKYLISEI